MKRLEKYKAFIEAFRKLMPDLVASLEILSLSNYEELKWKFPDGSIYEFDNAGGGYYEIHELNYTRPPFDESRECTMSIDQDDPMTWRDYYNEAHPAFLWDTGELNCHDLIDGDFEDLPFYVQSTLLLYTMLKPMTRKLGVNIPNYTETGRMFRNDLVVGDLSRLEEI